MRNFILLLIPILLYGCGNKCSDNNVIEEKHRMCSKLEAKPDESGNIIQTYGCATKNGESLVDYYVRGNQLCYKGSFFY